MQIHIELMQFVTVHHRGEIQILNKEDVAESPDGSQDVFETSMWVLS